MPAKYNLLINSRGFVVGLLMTSVALGLPPRKSVPERRLLSWRVFEIELAGEGGLGERVLSKLYRKER